MIPNLPQAFVLVSLRVLKPIRNFYGLEQSIVPGTNPHITRVVSNGIVRTGLYQSVVMPVACVCQCYKLYHDAELVKRCVTHEIPSILHLLSGIH